MSGTFFVMTLRGDGVLARLERGSPSHERHGKVAPIQETACMAIYELDGQAPELPADGHYCIADTAA